MKLIPADEYSLEELADAYNQTRIDYIVPMPMTVDRLRHYIEVYDVNLASSCAVVDNGEILGIGMLGVREQRGWITRLGVVPQGRRRGVGGSIMDFLLGAARHLGLPRVWLEVIQGNNPAYELFCALDFKVTRELIVARRPPRFAAMAPGQRAERPRLRQLRSLGYEATMALLASRQDNPNWLNQTESLRNSHELSSLYIETQEGGRGWVTYQTSLLQLTRIVVHVSEGDPGTVATALLQTLHEYYPTQDAIAENIPADDPIWDGFLRAGYFDAFRRIEMVRTMEERKTESNG